MPSSHLILCHPFVLLPSIFPSIRVFSNELALCIRWPKYWSFSYCISPSNEYSELISLRIEWFGFLAVQGTQESSPAPQFESVNSLMLSLLYGPTLTSIRDCWKNRNFDYMDLCWRSVSCCYEQSIYSLFIFLDCFNYIEVKNVFPVFFTLTFYVWTKYTRNDIIFHEILYLSWNFLF